MPCLQLKTIFRQRAGLRRSEPVSGRGSWGENGTRRLGRGLLPHAQRSGHGDSRRIDQRRGTVLDERVKEGPADTKPMFCTERVHTEARVRRCAMRKTFLDNGLHIDFQQRTPWIPAAGFHVASGQTDGEGGRYLVKAKTAGFLARSCGATKSAQEKV